MQCHYFSGMKTRRAPRRGLIFANIAVRLIWFKSVCERVPKLVPAGDSVVALSLRLLLEPRYHVFLRHREIFTPMLRWWWWRLSRRTGGCNSGKSSLDAREKQRAPTYSVIFFPSLYVSYSAKGLSDLLAFWSPFSLRLLVVNFRLPSLASFPLIYLIYIFAYISYKHYIIYCYIINEEESKLWNLLSSCHIEEINCVYIFCY